MEIKWMEDFLALAQAQSFSRAAELRNVTQSGLSRRIRSLEQWVGAALVDRSGYPATLTPAGKLFKENAEEILRQLFDTRAVIRKQQRLPGMALQIAAGHTLSLNFLPPWLHGLRSSYGELSVRIIASNVHDAVLTLVNGGCELMLAYHHAALPVQLDAQRYTYVTVGQDTLMPLCKPGPRGAPAFRLPGSKAHALPLLAYNPASFFGRCMQLVLTRAQGASGSQPYLHPCYEADMSELLKYMALQGDGLAWLPHSAAVDELERGLLVPAGGKKWSLDLEIRLYRDVLNQDPMLERLWQFLCAKHAK
ncbi:LysR substrate-binding domain-containing protein [Burkholderia sp. L27(2015)]|uniref:LysR substrate-binding domain-containing protein n=1 Tax=Burkholderia sp. L27(2015) TaxID=1641858 RepID=UPI00131CB5C5|nr:LysR substrate-binding domain-containing protein [Burkholderia sp. L27(2015)]